MIAMQVPLFFSPGTIGWVSDVDFVMRYRHFIYSATRNPNSTLINGLGRYEGGPATDLAVVNVQQGKR